MAQDMDASPNDAPARSVTPYTWLMLVLLTLTFILGQIDRQLVANLAEPIKRDLQLSDTELGLLTGSLFALFYSLMGIPVAAVADRGRRVTIIGVACILWSSFTAMFGVAQSFVQLALARIGVAASEAGCAAPSLALLGDLFPPGRRGLALGIFLLGVPIGSALALAL